MNDWVQRVYNVLGTVTIVGLGCAGLAALLHAPALAIGALIGAGCAFIVAMIWALWLF